MIATLPHKPATVHHPLIKYHFLVIGYGDELRGDDAVGPFVAKAVEQWNLPTVKTLAVPHLVPELAAEIAQANHVIFVDAATRQCKQSVQIDPLVACADMHQDSRHSRYCDPCSLLKLTHTFHGRAPRAWSLKVATECFESGCELSRTADQGCDRALRTIAQFLTTYQPPKHRQTRSFSSVLAS